MKKKLLNSLLLLSLITISTISNASISCAKNQEDNMILFVGSLRYNNLEVEKELLKNKCVVNLSSKDNYILEDVNTVEALDIILKNNKAFILNDARMDLNRDFFSDLLLREVNKVEREKIFKKEDPEIRQRISKVDVNNLLNKSWKPSEEDYNKLLNFVGSSYYNNSTNLKDNKGEYAINYVILANKPELIKYSYTVFTGKKAWTIKNNNGFSALHFMFSPSLKNKDVKKLNDLMLKEVPVSYLINTNLLLGTGKTFDYFQFAELMKNNNPDLYQKLKNMYKFEIKNLNNDKTVISFIENKLK